LGTQRRVRINKEWFIKGDLAMQQDNNNNNRKKRSKCTTPK
jgi:hypothetical protein